MDLKYYLSIMWGNKWIIITTLVVTMIVVIAGTMVMTPVYTATATLRIATASSGSVTTLDYYYADRLMNTYTRIATSNPVLNELANRLNLSSLPDVNVSPVSSTELLQVLIKSPDPVLAQNAANALADILVTQSQELYSGGEKSTTEILSEQLTAAESDLNQARVDYESVVAQTPNDTDAIDKASLVVDLKQKTYETLLDEYEAARVREALRENTITIVDPAVLPTKPSSPRVLINIALGGIVGFVGGIGLAFLYENLNPRIYSLDQIESIADHDVLGKIPFSKTNGLAGIFNKTIPVKTHNFKGSFQNLQAKIAQQISGDHKIKSFILTSAVPGEGKSTIVANLAIAMGSVRQSVVIVDSDLRLPVQHKIFGLSNKVGLSTLLTQQTRIIDVLQKSRYPNTWVLTSGPSVPNPMDLLGSPQIKSVIDLLTQKFDYVILDTPAMLPVGDALVLSSLVDAIILVVRQSYCKEDDFRETCKQLSDLDSKLMGVIVNDARKSRSYYYSKYKSS